MIARRLGAVAAAALALALVAVGAKMVRVYRAAQAEFHLRPWSVGPLPGGLRGASAVAFPSRDGSVLRGWYVPPGGPATVVLLHGSEADRRQLLPEALALADAGFGVLLFDWPGLGESGGKVTWSATERGALQGALDWLERRAPGQRIGALGFSCGASVLATTAADDPRLRALVLEATILDLDDEVTREYPGWGPVSFLAARLGKRAGGWDAAAPKPLDAALRLRALPLLIINGAADPVAPPSDAQRLFDAAATANKRLWIIPGAAHGGYAGVAPALYPRALAAFFGDALLN